MEDNKMERLQFIPITENEQREFRMAAHRETSRLIYGASFTDKRIEQAMDFEMAKAQADPETGMIGYLGDKPVGIAMVEDRERDGNKFIWVHFFYISPEFRDKGYGKQLLKYAEKFARKRGYSTYCLRTSTLNPAAIGFYEYNGFTYVEGADKITDDGIALNLYIKDVPELTADDYSFSLANQEDIPAIISIYRSLVGTPGCTWDYEYPSQETAERDIARQELFVLKKGGSIVAVASAGVFDELADLTWKSKNPCELARIGVSPDLHNQGVGTEILRHVMETVNEKGFDGIRMLVAKTNFPALALYEKNGFKRCGEVFRFNTDFYCYEIQFD
jgi:ribosomal protein S18 acetylase RimI-like enzyme